MLRLLQRSSTTVEALKAPGLNLPQAPNSAGRQYHDRIGEYAGQDRRKTRQGLGQKSGHIGHFAIRFQFSQKNGRQYADRDADKCTKPYRYERAYDGIAETAAFLESRRGEFGENLKTQTVSTLDDQSIEH